MAIFICIIYYFATFASLQILEIMILGFLLVIIEMFGSIGPKEPIQPLGV